MRKHLCRFGIVGSLTGSSRYHDRIDLAENDVDAAGHAWHDRARGDSDKSCHECVFNQILTPIVLPNLHLQNDINKLAQFWFSPYIPKITGFSDLGNGAYVLNLATKNAENT
jgi:hypothetical protein